LAIRRILFVLLGWLLMRRVTVRNRES
jgi:hypothetical protein